MAWGAAYLDGQPCLSAEGLLFPPKPLLKPQHLPPAPPPGRYQERRDRGCRHRDLTQPAGEGDTRSISCERGAFLVPPLLFSWCLEENRNYLLRPPCLCRAGLGKAVAAASQRPRGRDRTVLTAAGASGPAHAQLRTALGT